MFAFAITSNNPIIWKSMIDKIGSH